MLTRSETPPPPPPPLTEETSARSEGRGRSVLLATLAGLLAIAGAFLVVRYLNQNNSDPVAATPIAETRQVLIATGTIPAGTDVDAIIADPEAYLAARSAPLEFVASDTITSVGELDALAGQTLGSDMIAGDHLTAARFVERATFQQDSFLERTAAIPAPDGHHTIVVSVPADRALNGNLRPGEQVTVIGSFRVNVPEQGQPFEMTVMVLPAVEVVYVEASDEATGQLASDADSLGRSYEGDIDVTLAVEPNEVTDLVFALEYGSITLAGAIDDSSNLDDRPVSTVESVVDGTDITITKGDEIRIADLFPFDMLVGQQDRSQQGYSSVAPGQAVESSDTGSADDADTDADS